MILATVMWAWFRCICGWIYQDWGQSIRCQYPTLNYTNPFMECGHHDPSLMRLLFIRRGLVPDRGLKIRQILSQEILLNFLLGPLLFGWVSLRYSRWSQFPVAAVPAAHPISYPITISASISKEYKPLIYIMIDSVLYISVKHILWCQNTHTL